jgi:dihydrodipicolinate synthase/N-acetylneuraminate lyase
MSRRVIGILPTPFRDSGELDVAAAVASLASTAERHGVDSVLLGGAYGEFVSLTAEERVGLVATVARELPRVQIMGCAAALATEKTAQLSRRLFDAGAATVMVAAPLAQEVDDADVVRHFAALAAAVGHDLVAYNNVVFGRDLPAAVLAAVLGDPAFVAVKQGTPAMRAFLRTVEMARAAATRPHVVGASDLVLPMTLAAGADAVSSTNLWVFPEAILGTVEAFDGTDLARCRELHGSWSEYREFAAVHGQPATVKVAMRLRGYRGGVAVRRPLAALGPARVRELEGILARCDRRREEVATR